MNALKIGQVQSLLVRQISVFDSILSKSQNTAGGQVSGLSDRHSRFYFRSHANRNKFVQINDFNNFKFRFYHSCRKGF